MRCDYAPCSPVRACARTQIPLSYIESRLQGLRNPKTYPPPKDAPIFTLRDMVDLLSEYVAVIPSGGGLIPQVFMATQLLSVDTEADLSVFEPDGTKHGLKMDDNLWWYLETERTGLVYPSKPDPLPSIDLKQLLQEQHPSIYKHLNFDVVWKGKDGLKGKNVIDPSANLLPYDFRTSVSLTIERT